ncbi:MAG: superoxide dismutase [Fe] [Deltaproteobacteria bacterium HGW-Deltaproteobacteria-21]|nr:MAG: superoxide dismutase [Fe] [Deltaproteobacteria bacterium HGW-Deltaproteobacteria-21]
MAVTLPDLPYSKEALAPVISAKTLEFHHGKHHKTYVETTNKLIAGTEMENADLETIIKKSVGDQAKTGLFNNSAQVWNHTFFWNCMKPNGGGAPNGPIADKIKGVWGDYKKFAEELKNAGVTQFGSGWAWLVVDGRDLKITKTANADTPIAHNLKPLLTIDVWEHAYYLDYQNRRADFLAAVIEKLINWDFVNANFK